MNYFFVFSLIALNMPLSLVSATIIQGDDLEAPRAFTVKINTQAYDPVTGMLFVGLQPDATNPTYAVSRASRQTFDQITTFTPVAQNSDLSGKEVDLMTISSQPNSAPFVSLVLHGDEFMYVMTADGSIVEPSAVLNDASGMSTSLINSLAASASTVFSTVSPNAGGGFLDADSGIAVSKIITLNGILNSLQTKDATTGLDGNIAAPLNVTSPAVTASTASVTVQPNAVNSLYYDSVFDRLYTAVQVTSGTVSGNVANSIVVGQLNSSNILNFYSSAPSSALANGTNGIVITKSGGSAQSASSFEPKVMHTSTGPSYLIINGGPDVATNVGNTVYALPLVNNPSLPTIHGTLAKKDSALVHTVFTVPATAPGDLPIVSDAAALVGSGPLPTVANTTIADIQVYGDAVYVALNETPSITTDTGLFSSQALFDATGKIIRWTPWQFHIVPLNAFPNSSLPGGATDDGGVKFFSVDPLKGNITITEGTTDQTVGVTNWNSGFTSTDIVQTLNNNFPTGVYSALDLPYHTNGFASATNYRYALFGGNGMTTFMVTSQLNGLQETPTTDFSTPQTILNAPIPGTARVLEYSRRPTGSDTNYFFAGTSQGFFAFTDSAGNGFDVSALADLDSTLFTTRSWQHISTIIGEPIAIKSSGNGNLYILTRTLTSNPLQPFTNTLYSVPFAPTVGTMFAPGNIRTIAQTGSETFTNSVQFFDIGIISTGATGSPAAKEQLVLATNRGLYYSDADQTSGNGIIDALNDSTAIWTLEPSTATTMFHKIQSPNTPIQNTIWPLSMQDAAGVQTFDNSSIHQFSGSGNNAGTAIMFNNGFIPPNFNNRDALHDPQLFDLVEGFWTDGSRRFVISRNQSSPSAINNLNTSPLTLNASNPSNQLPLNRIKIKGVNHFYWISQIGASGQLLAGTDRGIIALS